MTFVTDRGSNFKYGLKSAGFDRRSCLAHLVHNLIEHMLSKGRAHEIIVTAAKVTAIVKNSNINSQLPKSIKSFSKTRWNGTYCMLQSIIVNFDQIFDLLYQRQRQDSKQTCFDLISSLKLEELKAVCAFLKQFTDIIRNIEGESYETLSLFWPVYTNLYTALGEDVLAANDEFLRIVEDMKVGLSYLNTRKCDFKPTMKHKIATVLNPLFKSLKEICEIERNQVYEEIQKIIREQTPIETSQNITETIETSRRTQNLTKIHPFFHSFYKVDENENETCHPTEFDSYIEHRITAHHSNIDDWWNENRSKYPQLFKLYVKISAIPVSSASGERVFSRTGLVVTDRRSVILPENVNNIIMSRNSI